MKIRQGVRQGKTVDERLCELNLAGGNREEAIQDVLDMLEAKRAELCLFGRHLRDCDALEKVDCTCGFKKACQR
jgi:hypothetical protein